MDELDVEAIDLGDEHRQIVQPRLDLSPVVIGHPVANEFLQLCQLHALGLIRDRLPMRPTGCGQAPAKIDDYLLRDVDRNGRTACAAAVSARADERVIGLPIAEAANSTEAELARNARRLVSQLRPDMRHPIEFVK